eukprot:646116-Pyramimonas_sp.AAC.1
MRPGVSTEAGAQPIHSLAFRVVKCVGPTTAGLLCVDASVKKNSVLWVMLDFRGCNLLEQVMRLCRPSIQIENPLKFFPGDLDPTQEVANDASAPEVPFQNRTNMTDTTQAFGIGGMMVLPQSFG